MLTRAAMAALLRGWDVRVDVLDVEVLAGGGNSATYGVSLADGLGSHDIVVKVYPEQLRWKLSKELFVYGLLQDHPGVHTPRVVWSKEPDDASPDAVLVLARLPGRMLSEVGAEAGVYREIGRQLRSMHEITFDRFGYLCAGVVDPHPSNRAYMEHQFTKKLLAFTSLGGEAELAARCAAFVAEHASAFDVCDRAALCHDDLYENNVLVDRDGDRLVVSGLLDVENAVAGDPLLDLAKTWLYSIRADMWKWTALLHGYGPLGPRASERLDLYRAYHVLELGCWLATVHGGAPAPDLVDDLRSFVTGATPLPVRSG